MLSTRMLVPPRQGMDSTLFIWSQLICAKDTVVHTIRSIRGMLDEKSKATDTQQYHRKQSRTA